jgi:hypothetical protein
MLKRILPIALVTLCGGFTLPASKSCECKPAERDATTRFGGNEWVAYKEPGVFKSIHGKLDLPLPELRANVLVEVFDQPDYLLCEWLDKNPNNCTNDPPENQRRIAACVTAKDGKFCFPNLPAGKYELRVSKDAGWSPTHVHVVVNPRRKDASSKGIEVRLNLGF